MSTFNAEQLKIVKNVIINKINEACNEFRTYGKKYDEEFFNLRNAANKDKQLQRAQTIITKTVTALNKYLENKYNLRTDINLNNLFHCLVTSNIQEKEEKNTKIKNQIKQAGDIILLELAGTETSNINDVLKTIDERISQAIKSVK